MKNLILILLIVIPTLLSAQSCTHTYVGNPYLPMHAVITDIKINHISTGDIIAVFDDSLCVGYTKVHESDPYFLIILYADDPTTSEKDGYTEGNQLIFKYCQQSLFSLQHTRWRFTSGNETFTHLGTWIGELKVD